MVLLMTGFDLPIPESFSQGIQHHQDNCGHDDTSTFNKVPAHLAHYLHVVHPCPVVLLLISTHALQFIFAELPQRRPGIALTPSIY